MARSNEVPAHVFFVAVDGGPREALAPLATHCGAKLAATAGPAAEADAHWVERLKSEGAAALAVGTSDSARGRRIESAARRAAGSLGLPIVAIEDFPGNYCDVDGGSAALVVVESEAAKEICARKLAPRLTVPRIEAAPPVRYDAHRARVETLRQRTRSLWTSAGRIPVLWAGQPETEDGLHTLGVLAPHLASRDIELMFKAHPRDEGYAAGAYHALLRGVRWSDWTRASMAETLDAAPRLVVTQFSSLAVEAGFYGIPSLWLLLPDAGALRLRQKKGYAVPPLCLAGGAVLVTRAEGLGGVLERALTNVTERDRLITCFDAYFGGGAPAGGRIATWLGEIATPSPPGKQSPK